VLVCTLGFLIVRRLLGLAGLGPAPDAKEIKIAVLRHQLAVQRRQIIRPRYSPADPGGVGAAAAAGTVGSVPGHPGNAAALAPGVGGPPLDAPAGWSGWPRPTGGEGFCR